jgi:glyoxylate/hydroxypyruvate reductase A
VLDVFEHEPLPVTDPIWSNPNITVLPHISAPTDMSSSIKVAADNIKNYREFLIIPETVNTQLGY